MKYPCLYNSFPVTYQLQKYLADWIKNIYYSGSPDSVEVLPSRFENVPPAFKSFSSKKKTKKSKKLPTYCVFCKVGSYIKYSCHLSKSIHDCNWFLKQVSIQFYEMFQIKYGIHTGNMELVLSLIWHYFRTTTNLRQFTHLMFWRILIIKLYVLPSMCTSVPSATTLGIR